VLVGIDAVDVMAAYQPVVQACGVLAFLWFYNNVHQLEIQEVFLILSMDGASMKIDRTLTGLDFQK
jgi:hypothetical protein